MNFQKFKFKYQSKTVKENINEVDNQPLVSVCVQTYQHFNFIKQCLDGILIQKTTFPFEILLGDDESTDGTREICLEYAEKYPDKIRLFLHHRVNNIKVDGKATGRFNFLYNLYSARGKYIAFCEGDDYWTDPYKLQKQVDFLEKNIGFVISFHDSKVIDLEENLITKSYLQDTFKGSLAEEDLQKGAVFLLLTACFRNVIKEYPPEFFKVVNGDKFLISLLGRFGKGVYQHKVKSSVYRHHPLGLVSAKTSFEKEINHVTTFYYLNTYYQRIGDNGMGDYYKKKYKDLLIYLIKNFKTPLENLRLIQLLISLKEYESSLFYGVYFWVNRFTGRGNFLRRRFIESMQRNEAEE